MRGSVRLDGSKQKYQFVFDGGCHPNGKRRQVTKSGFKTEGEALRAMRLAMVKYEQGRKVSGGATPLAAFLTETWLLQKRQGLAESTWVSYTGLVRTHIVADPIGQTAISDLRTADFSALYERMAAKPGRKGHGGLSRKTILLVHRILKPALDYAVAEDLIPSNPMKNQPAPKSGGTKASFSVWTPADVKDFISHVRNSPSSRMAPLYVLALTTGARRGELCGLTWRNVDLDTPSIRIEQTAVSVGYKVIIKDVKTPTSRRTIDLDPNAVEALQEVRRQQEEDRSLFGERWSRSGFVFTEPTGELTHPGGVGSRFARDVRNARVPTIRFHDLRHTFSTTALTQGQNPKVVQEILGHSSIRTTLSTYSHVLPGLHREAVAVVGDALFGEANGG
jgi:integrase